MANQVSGRVIAVSQVQTVATTDASKPPLKKREIYIDCTRYDPYTGERSQYENKPLLEFAGDKTLEKVNTVLDQVQKDDIVTVSFELVGRQYKGKDGKTVFTTAVRCYDIAITRKAALNGNLTAQPAPQQQPQYFDGHQPQHVPAGEFIPSPPMPQQAPMAQSPFVDGQSQIVEEQKKDDLPF